MRSQNALTGIDGTSFETKIAQARRGQHEPLAELMQAHNQRLFRIARSVLRNDGEAEDIVQETFVKAFTRASGLRDERKISPWLARIAVNLAYDRLRQIRRRDKIIEFPGELDELDIDHSFQRENGGRLSPERQAAMGDVRLVLETEIDKLPDGFREVFILRVVEQMTVDETAEALALRAATVKTRLHRAKTLLRKGLETQLTGASLNAFPFGGKRCARSTEAVLARLDAASRENGSKSHH